VCLCALVWAVPYAVCCCSLIHVQIHLLSIAHLREQRSVYVTNVLLLEAFNLQCWRLYTVVWNTVHCEVQHLLHLSAGWCRRHTTMKLNSAVLLGRHISSTVVQLTKPDAKFCVVRSVSTAASVDVSDDYDKSKPFSSIPGPTGLPYFGTLFYYRASKLFQSVYRIIVSHKNMVRIMLQISCIGDR